MEGRLFGDVPMNLELRLSVEDSPNSAGVAIDAIRCAKLAVDRGLGGPIEAPSAFFMKHPPRQWTDDEAHRRTEAFVRGDPGAYGSVRELAGLRAVRWPARNSHRIVST